MNYNKTKAACYVGYITHSVSVNLAPLLFACLMRRYGLSLAYLAAFTLVTFVVQIIMDISAAAFMERTGYRLLAVVSQLLSALGLMLFGALPLAMKPEVGLMIAAVVYSSGGGLSEVLLSPLIESLPAGERGSDLSLLHSFYSWGHVAVILVTTVAVRFTGDELWFLVPMGWSVIPFGCAKAFARVPMPPMDRHESGRGIGQLLSCRGFVMLLAMMLCSGAAEQIMAQWASYYAEVGLGAGKIAGDLAGPAIFALLMALGRAAYGRSADKMKIKRALTASSTVTLCCFLCAALARIPAVSLAAVGLSGLGISIMWPGILSLSKERYPGGGASMFAFLAFGGDIGCSLGPFLAGVVSEAAPDPSASLRWGILAGAVFPIVMLAGLALMHRRENEYL